MEFDFDCETCGATFLAKTDLTKHLKKVHGKSGSTKSKDNAYNVRFLVDFFYDIKDYNAIVLSSFRAPFEHF